MHTGFLYTGIFHFLCDSFKATVCLGLPPPHLTPSL
uniref:Uncharacterized protein n=1 Tax=Anguilla anguilla TaxID=7936 RepID=A0A0E9PZQ1_ANGAN